MHKKFTTYLLTSIFLVSCGGGGGGGGGGGNNSGGGYGEGGGSGSTNTAPELVGLIDYAIPENTTSITTVQATDAENNALIYSVTGTDASFFSIGSYSGTLAFKSAPNFEQPADAGGDNVYDIIIGVSDGSLSTSLGIIVSVTDANDAPKITSNNSFNAPENQISIGTVSATDEDNDNLTFTVSGTELEITSGGILNFSIEPDYETKSTYTATVTVTDGSLTDTQEITVNVTDVDENTAVANELFISEYAEGSSNNKYMEIYNGTGETISLDAYAWPSCGNACETPGQHEYWNTFKAGVSLQDGEIYTLCNSGYQDASVCDQTGEGVGYWNGNEAIYLVKGTEADYTVIDVIGTFDQSEYWNVCGVDSGLQEHTIIKKPGVEGNDDWAASAGTNATDCDWIVKDQDDFADFNKHTWSSGSSGGGGTGGGDGGGDGGGTGGGDGGGDGGGTGGGDGGGTGGGSSIPAGENELYISEYADVDSEGIYGNTKYIEIYNPYSEDVDLSPYTLKGISNSNSSTWGSASTTCSGNCGRVYELQGTIGSKDVLLITGVDSSFGDVDDYIVSQADIRLTYESPVHFNGDDAVGLFKGETLLDTIGQPEASDIGKGWDACGITAATLKHTLIKKEGKTGSSDWATSAGTNADDCHWIIKDEGYFEDAGRHLQEQMTLTASNGNFYIDGSEKPQLYLVVGKTYRIDTSDSSLATHPISFGDGQEATSSQTTYGKQFGTPGTAGSYYLLEITEDTPSVIYYFCNNHVGMGAAATVSAIANEEPVINMPESKVYSSLVSGYGRVNYMYSDEIVKNNIATVSATDADNDAVTFSLSGADANSLTISETGSLSFKNTPSYDQKNEYNITVVASDGKSTTTKSLVVFIDRFCTDSLLGLSVCLEDEKTYDGSYDRDADYATWHDWDGDCQNNRQEVLISESLPGTPITFTAASGTCTVETGKWLSKFNDEEYTSASDVSIDHMVPLSESHYSGAWKWSNKRKLIFANSLNLDEHLIAVYGPSNSQKSNCTPGPNTSWDGKTNCGPNGGASSEAKETWMPENTAYACEYLKDYVKVKSHFRLGIDATEKANIESQYSENSCSN